MYRPDKKMQIGIFAVIAVILAYIFGSRWGKSKAVSALESEIESSQLTYDLSQYSTLADRLETAMFRFNDDEDAIYAVFAKCRNKSDVLQLISSFGTRRMLVTIGKSNLTTWLYYKLSDKEIQHINEILTRNNINYQF